MQPERQTGTTVVALLLKSATIRVKSAVRRRVDAVLALMLAVYCCSDVAVYCCCAARSSDRHCFCCTLFEERDDLGKSCGTSSR